MQGRHLGGNWKGLWTLKSSPNEMTPLTWRHGWQRH